MASARKSAAQTAPRAGLTSAPAVRLAKDFGCAVLGRELQRQRAWREEKKFAVG
jgi:hypothetical protein